MRARREPFSKRRVAAFLLGHRIDDRHHPRHFLAGDLRLHVVRDLAHARQLVHQPGQAAHVLHLLELVAHVVEVELLALGDLLGELLRLVLVDLLLDLLDQRQHVAHVEDAAGDAVGMEHVQAVGLLAGADELDRLAGDVAHRQRGAAAGIAVGLGQHHAGQRQRFAEMLGGDGGVLAGHRVDHEQRLDRVDRGVQRLDLGHHRLVDAGAAGGVDDQHVDEGLARIVDRGADDGFGLLRRRRTGRTARRPAAPASSAARSRPDGRRRPTTTITFFLRRSFRCLASLATVVVLPAPCRPAIRITAGAGTLRLRSLACEPITAVSSSRTTLISAWPGRQRLQHFLADRAHLDALDQRLHHRQRDVGFEQRDAHFAQWPRGCSPRSGGRGRAGARWCRRGAGSGIRTWALRSMRKRARIIARRDASGALRPRCQLALRRGCMRHCRDDTRSHRRPRLSARRRPAGARARARCRQPRARLAAARAARASCCMPRASPWPGAKPAALDLHFFAALSLVGLGMAALTTLVGAQRAHGGAGRGRVSDRGGRRCSATRRYGHVHRRRRSTGACSCMRGARCSPTPRWRSRRCWR